MFHQLAAEAASGSTDFIATIIQWGPPGVVLVLLLTGMLITKGAHEEVKTDRDRWRDAYEKERTAHDASRDALADTASSAAAATEAARTTAALLTSLGHPTNRPGIGDR